jgi:hypothetical protein
MPRNVAQEMSRLRNEALEHPGTPMCLAPTPAELDVSPRRAAAHLVAFVVRDLIQRGQGVEEIHRQLPWLELWEIENIAAARRPVLALPLP